MKEDFGAPQLKGEEEAVECVMKAIELSGYKGKIELATDVAASDFFDDKDKLYNMGKKTKETDKKVTGDKL